MSAISTKLKNDIAPHTMGAIAVFFLDGSISGGQAISRLNAHLDRNGYPRLKTTEEAGLSQIKTWFDTQNNFAKAAAAFRVEKGHQALVDGDITEAEFDALFNITV